MIYLGDSRGLNSGLFACSILNRGILLDELSAPRAIGLKHTFCSLFETEEQDIASKYITKDDKVLELGARYGTVSAIILDNISDVKNCVIVDPDRNITHALTDNLKNCEYGDAQIYIGTIGEHKKKIHTNDSYATYTEACEDDSCDIENMTYKDLQNKYNIVLVQLSKLPALASF